VTKCSGFTIIILTITVHTVINVNFTKSCKFNTNTKHKSMLLIGHILVLYTMYVTNEKILTSTAY